MVAQNSRCLLLDEPTSALDIAHQVQCTLTQRHQMIAVARRHIDIVQHRDDGQPTLTAWSTACRAASVSAPGWR
jgi:ABC-type Mn2+/Zn2+ transport system ATPase subunit